MAASGIQEHNEALRKERVIQRKAYAQKAMGEGVVHNYQPAMTSVRIPQEKEYYYKGNAAKQATSYEAEILSRRVGSPPGIGHDPMAVDRFRREQHAASMAREYSAKIPHRYNNFDYTSQW